jgi:hypothetical protein
LFIDEDFGVPDSDREPTEEEIRSAGLIE